MPLRTGGTPQIAVLYPVRLGRCVACLMFFKTYFLSVTLQAFRINLSNLSGDSIEARCFIDGRFLSRILVRPGVVDYVDGVQITDSAVRPFVFSDVTVIGELPPVWPTPLFHSHCAADDENVLISTTYNPDKFGSIEVHIHRVIVREEYHWNRGQLSYSDPGPLPEKSKKAGCHQVSYVAVMFSHGMS